MKEFVALQELPKRDTETGSEQMLWGKTVLADQLAARMPLTLRL